MADASAAALECLDESGDGLRVEFAKQGDRFGHSIFSICSGEASLLLKSVEGSPDDFSPPSPPFAELHRQNEAIFLSGATTIGHWSMSVNVKNGRLCFEVACRLKSEVERLGSTYQHHGLDEFNVEYTDGTDSSHEKNLWSIEPSRQSMERFPTTLQWGYSLSGFRGQ